MLFGKDVVQRARACGAARVTCTHPLTLPACGSASRGRGCGCVIGRMMLSSSCLLLQAACHPAKEPWCLAVAWAAVRASACVACAGVCDLAIHPIVYQFPATTTTTYDSFHPHGTQLGTPPRRQLQTGATSQREDLLLGASMPRRVRFRSLFPSPLLYPRTPPAPPAPSPPTPELTLSSPALLFIHFVGAKTELESERGQTHLERKRVQLRNQPTGDLCPQPPLLYRGQTHRRFDRSAGNAHHPAGSLP